MSEKDYMQILEDSLKKKVDILRQLQILCQEQGEILQDSNALPETLEENVKKKDALIQQLDGLDQGFEHIFERVRGELDENREAYRDVISRMQQWIREITQRSASLQVMEQHNRDLAQKKFSDVRTQVKELRRNERVVSSYYRNMMKAEHTEPRFMDSKK